jgi:L,D-peptidoglycan transpeptidase YkuD (ErfK/YbiS/YcfS/YnhG family)
MARLANAKESLERAADGGALRYAEAKYRRAELLYQAGWMELAHQNGRITLFRNYDKADTLLLFAEDLAEAGLADALDSLKGNAKRMADEIRSLEAEVRTWRDALDGALIVYNAERFWTDAELHLKTARQLTRDKEFDEAHDSIILGRKALARLGAVLAERAEDEASKIKIWRRWVDDAIHRSAQDGSIAIIVDKVAHKTYVLRAGKVIRTYNCDLGYNSARPKLFAGDGATPEGVYHVTVKKSSNSKFYKALLLNYPSDADRVRFAENKRKGIISRHAGIGRLIEIHGDGGNGSDWTDGCVALANSDMDDIMKYAGVGTPVVIVRKYDGWR